MDLKDFEKHIIPKIEAGRYIEAVRQINKTEQYAGQDRRGSLKKTFKPITDELEKVDELRKVEVKVNMTYSWHNISKFYKNNTIKYSPDSGSSWKKITFRDGNYSYDDLNDVIKQTLENNGDDPKKIEISFINSQYKVLIGLSARYQLDLRRTKFGELIGFEEKLVEKEEIGSKLPNITNSIDVIYLNIDAVSFFSGWNFKHHPCSDPYR